MRKQLKTKEDARHQHCGGHFSSPGTDCRIDLITCICLARIVSDDLLFYCGFNQACQQLPKHSRITKQE
ncbi:hypothetical protein SUGI_1000870 [Cryptomeria japonica]|nr:hypothetical protein SUGI_1000870 [Cryptomeria japonica]